MKLRFQLPCCRFSFFFPPSVSATNQSGRSNSHREERTSLQGAIRREDKRVRGNVPFSWSTQRMPGVISSSGEGQGFPELACHQKKKVWNSCSVRSLLLVFALSADGQPRKRYFFTKVCFKKHKLLPKSISKHETHLNCFSARGTVG